MRDSIGPILMLIGLAMSQVCHCQTYSKSEMAVLEAKIADLQKEVRRLAEFVDSIPKTEVEIIPITDKNGNHHGTLTFPKQGIK